MFNRSCILFLLPLAGLVGGCPLPPHPDTPVSYLHQAEPITGRSYYLYVPSFYKADRDWPLVVTLHGTYGWDGPWAQIKEWKYVAETHGFIVVAPQLRSVQGIVPVADLIPGQWKSDLESDEKAILAIIDDLKARYRIDWGDPKTGRRPAVMLTGFSAGGYPLYHTGLRNPKRFNMLIARACNSRLSLFETAPLNDDVRRTPIAIFWGKDDLGTIHDQSWQAFEWLRTHRCFEAKAKKVQGGHLRRPETAYQMWLPHLPKEMRL